MNSNGATPRTLNRPEALWQSRQAIALAEALARTAARLCAAIGNGSEAVNANALRTAAARLARDSRGISRALEAS